MPFYTSTRSPFIRTSNLRYLHLYCLLANRRSWEMPDEYNLPRHSAESTRLDAQHEAYAKIIGFLLHPRIASVLPKDARIADVGTGTGAWLRDLARTCPETWQLQGLDISEDQFPPEAKRGRIGYDKMSILEDVPERFRAQFDVVHMRLLVLGLFDHEWPLAAKNALQLLKPGGWIQWHESQFRELEMFQMVPGASTKHNERIIHAVMSTLNKQGKILDHVRHLRDIVQEAGFGDCEEDKFSTERAPEARLQLMNVQVSAMEFIGRLLAEKDPGFPMSKVELDEAIQGAWKEVENDKVYGQWRMRVVTGRRPS